MAQNYKVEHFWNLLCVNFQKMVLEVKKINSPGPLTLKQCLLPFREVPPPISGGASSHFGRCLLPFREVWKVDFLQVFLLDFSQGISLGLLCHIFVMYCGKNDQEPQLLQLFLIMKFNRVSSQKYSGSLPQFWTFSEIHFRQSVRGEVFFHRSIQALKPPLHHLPACWHKWKVRKCV